jgi:hypothetical protein
VQVATEVVNSIVEKCDQYFYDKYITSKIPKFTLNGMIQTQKLVAKVKQFFLKSLVTEAGR